MINIEQMIRDYADSNHLKAQDVHAGWLTAVGCLSVTGTQGQCLQLISEVASELMTNVFEYGRSDDEDYHDRAQQALATLLNHKVDVYGSGVVVYWPDLLMDK